LGNIVKILNYVISDEKRTIRSLQKTKSPQGAMAKLLNILDEKDCPGKWQIFKQSLFEDGKFILYQMNIITRFVTRATRWVPLVDQELLTLPELTPVFSGVRVVRSLVFCVVFCRSLFVIFLLTIVLFVLRFTDTDYHFGNIQTLRL
jgi:hypothetical protein